MQFNPESASVEAELDATLDLAETWQGFAEESWVLADVRYGFEFR